jgi:hypothetical protein
MLLLGFMAENWNLPLDEMVEMVKTDKWENTHGRYAL